MSSALILWLLSVWLGCAPTPSQSGSALEQMEAEIARIVEQVRPSVLGVSVDRKQGKMGNYFLRLGNNNAFAGADEAEFEEDALAPEAPEMEEETLDELQELREKAIAERDHARALQKEAKDLEQSARELHGHRQLLELAQTAPRAAWSATITGKSIGSGFAIEGNYVVTTHTIAAGGGEEITISLPDGKEAKGKLVGSDDATDIALLKMEEGSAPALRFGDSSKCRAGSIGIFLSRSYGKLDNVNFGFVTGREEAGGGDMLRLNFPIGPGESGSPLLNARGEVIGIASANLRKNVRILTPSALAGSHSFSYTVEAPEPTWGTSGSREFSYFIPAERVKAVIEDLKNYGEVRRAWFGVGGEDTTIKVSATEKQHGVLVKKVIDDSSALKAGIQVGDIILRCNGQPTPHFAALLAIIEKLTVGKTVEVVVRRSGKEIELDVTPQARPGSSKTPKAAAGDLGLTLVPKSKELASYLNLDDSPEGKVVASVAKDSIAERSGIRKGDLLLDDPKAGKTVRVWRAGKTLEIEIAK